MSDEVLNKKEFLSEIIPEWMEVIDRSLAMQGVAISARLFRASALFVEHAVEDFISEDGKRDSSAEIKKAFLTSKSFQEFFVEIYKWYVDKYGMSFEDKQEWTLAGFVVFAGDTFEMKIPVTKDERISETEIKINFLNKIEDTDHPIDWICRPLIWSKFSKKQNQTLRDDLNIVAGSLRKIRSELMTTNHPDAKADALRSDIPVHLENAADIVLRRRSYGLAIWEIHQACEKMIKLILRQSHISYPLTHEVTDLARMVPKQKSDIVLNNNLKLLPTGKDAVSFRYGERRNLNVLQIFDIYKNSLIFLTKCTDALETDYPLGGRSITIRKPEFIP